MNRSQETHPIRVNARYNMNWTNSFSRNSGNPNFGQIYGHQRAEIDARNTKIRKGQETDHILANTRYEMN